MIPRAVLPLLLLPAALCAAPTAAPHAPAKPTPHVVEPPLPSGDPVPPPADDTPLPDDIIAPGNLLPAEPAEQQPVPEPFPATSVPTPTPLPPADASGAVPAPRVKMHPTGPSLRTWGEGNPFVIWGGDPKVRARLFTAATSVRQTLLAALNQPDTFLYPIVVQLREPDPDSRRLAAVTTSVTQLDDSFRIEINITPRQGSVPGELLRKNFLKASLAEMILRGQGNVNLDGVDAPPPDWLLHGSLELLDYRELGRLSESFATVFRLGRVLSVEEILRADPDSMDSVSATIYRVSCCGLLLTLLEQPRGAEGMTALLGSLAGSKDDAAAILGAFPKLSSSANGLGKWWSLQIAKLAQPGVDELLTPAETESGLAAAVTLHFTPPAPADAPKPGKIRRLFKKTPEAPAVGAAAPEPGKPAEGGAPPAPTEQQCDIREFTRVTPLPDAKAVFERSQLALTRLLLRAHPLYRPIITDYHEALRNLVEGKKAKETAVSLERLAGTRTAIAAKLSEIEDYLNWYQATQMKEPSGQFRDYLRVADELTEPPPPRADAISRYLDAMEEEYADQPESP